MNTAVLNICLERIRRPVIKSARVAIKRQTAQMESCHATA